MAINLQGFAVSAGTLFNGVLAVTLRTILAMLAGIALYILSQQSGWLKPLFLVDGPSVYLDSQLVPPNNNIKK